MAYLEGLTFQSDKHDMRESRDGIPQYERKFKITTKKNAVIAIQDENIRAEGLLELTSKIVSSLSDDALKIAMDIGEEAIAKPSGL